MLRHILCSFTATLLICLQAFPQNDPEKEERSFAHQHEVVVTATRLESSLKETASSVTVITREDLERSKKTMLLEALREVSGLNVIQSGPTGGSASVQLRGANSEHTLVMLDGVELNDPISPSRSCDLAHLTVENIVRVEILRGPQSTLYGSDALAGVINIITQRGKGKARFHTTALGGSFSTFSGSAGVSGSTGQVDYYASVSALRTGGFSAASTSYPGNEEADGYRNLAFSTRLGFQPARNLDFDVSLRTLRTKADIDSFGGDFGDDPNSTQSYDSFFLRAHARGLFLHNRWEQKITVSLVAHNRTYENMPDSLHLIDAENGQFKSKQWKLDWQNNVFLHSTNTLTFGLEHQLEQGESEYHSESSWGVSTDLFPQQKAHNTGLYVQDQMRLGKKIFITAGVRVSTHSLAGSATTFRITSAFINEDTETKVKATLGTGFKSPSLYQLHAPASLWGPIGNQGLAPEKSESWDAGIEQSLFSNKASVTVTVFTSRYDNLIDFDFALGYINIRKAHSRGTEISVLTKPAKKVLIETSFVWTDAKDEDTGEHLLRRPKSTFTAKLGYGFLDNGSLLLSLVHVGKREDILYAGWISERVTMLSYTLINAAVSYGFSQHVQGFIRFDNILDKDYEVISGYGTPGFSAYGGFEIQF